jgi:hypothetical protein
LKGQDFSRAANAKESTRALTTAAEKALSQLNCEGFVSVVHRLRRPAMDEAGFSAVSSPVREKVSA